jgi:hypothetical protein
MVTECSFTGCTRPVHTKRSGLCVGHYGQQRRGTQLRPLTVQRRRPNQTFCLQCSTQKAREDFSARVSGLQLACKVCQREDAQARRDQTRASEPQNGDLAA